MKYSAFSSEKCVQIRPTINNECYYSLPFTHNSLEYRLEIMDMHLTCETVQLCRA